MRHNEKLLYDLLFQTAARLLLAYGQTYLKGKIGFTIVLHTWGQTIQFHPHVHCMVTGGALVQTKQGGKWQPARKQWLFPVKKLSADFRWAFCAGVLALARQGQLVWDEAAMGQTIGEMVASALQQDWEVYIEAPPKGADNRNPETLAEYLGRYMHAIAISNHRILHVGPEGVTFRYRDNRENGAEKEMTLPGWRSSAVFYCMYCPIVLCAFVITACITVWPRPTGGRRGRCWAWRRAAGCGEAAPAGLAQELSGRRPEPVSALRPGADAHGAGIWAGHRLAGSAGAAAGHAEPGATGGYLTAERGAGPGAGRGQWVWWTGRGCFRQISTIFRHDKWGKMVYDAGETAPMKSTGFLSQRVERDRKQGKRYR
ncbi:MAG: transposase [Chloroflexi bacterium]|nr:transposase [Chloroflexota bacterium]